MGVVKDYNGVDIIQTPDYIEMSSRSYIIRLLKSHGWDTPTTKQLPEENLPLSKNILNIPPAAAAASINKVQVKREDGIIVQPVTDDNDNDHSRINQNSPKDLAYYWKSSKPMSPLPSDCIEQIYSQEGPLENTTAHLVLEKKSGFNYRSLLGELMYAFITCRPDIGYAVTTLSKFASSPSQYHYGLLKGVAKYLRNTIDWGIRFRRTKQLLHPEFQKSVWYNIPVEPINEKIFNININVPTLIGFVDAAHGNELRKRRSTTGLVYTFCGGAVVYKSKTQSLTAGSSTEAEFIAAHHAAKIAKYLRMVLKQLGYEQRGPTVIHIDNLSALNIINNNTSPTDRTRHLDLRYFAIQDWREAGDIVMEHIPGVINPSDDLTKPLGYVLHARHCRRIMGHYT